MPNERYVFQEVTRLTAGAVGVPGQRTFYLVAGNEDTLVRVWLEKEQLQALSAAIQEVLADLKGREATQSGESPEAPGLEAGLEESLQGDFHVGRLALGFDEARDMLVLLVYEADDEEEKPTLHCWATRRQMQALGQRAAAVCAGGRPSCPLCGGPMDPTGHRCPKSNGHNVATL